MRIIAFSDLHSHEHDEFSYLLPNGMNSRLADCLSVIDKVMYYRDKYDCDVALNAGDTFHIPAVTNTVVFQETYKQLARLADTSKQMVTLAGNHDMAAITKDGTPVSTVYAIGRLPDSKLAVGRYRSIEVKSTVFHCLPYIKDHGVLDHDINRMQLAIKRFKNRTNVIVTHIGLDEAVNGPNEIKLGGYPVDRLRKLGADRILSGHHHSPQRFEGHANVIGSPIQHNMLDRGDRRGLLVYDTKENSVMRIWLNGSTFHMYEINTKKDFDKLSRDQEKFRGGYIRVGFDPAVISESKVHDIVSVSAKMYRILPLKQTKSGMRSEQVTQKAVANIGNMSAVIPDYVEHVASENLNKKRLVSIGRRLLNP